MLFVTGGHELAVADVDAAVLDRTLFRRVEEYRVAGLDVFNIHFFAELAQFLGGSGDFVAEFPVAVVQKTGNVEFVDNAVEASVGTVAVRAVFENPNWKSLEGALLPGMFVRAFVTYGSRPNGILIPQQGLFRNAKGEPYVWVVDAANKTTQRPIVSELTLGGAVVVDSGLQAGDRIVVEGVQFISQDAEVAPTEASVPVIRDFEQAASAAVAPVQAEAPAAEAAPVQAEAPAQAE
jgi:multidrug efflux pump subunit AcrA (membrane-fusion protein)